MKILVAIEAVDGRKYTPSLDTEGTPCFLSTELVSTNRAVNSVLPSA
jgi:hypothetical protein